MDSNVSDELQKTNANIWKEFNSLEKSIRNINHPENSNCVEEKIEESIENVFYLRMLCCTLYKKSIENYERQIGLFQAENRILRNQIELLQVKQQQLEAKEMQQMELQMGQLQMEEKGGVWECNK